MSKEKFDHILKSLEVPEVLTDEQSWASVQNKIANKHEVSVRRLVPSWLYAAAAAVITGFGIFLFLQHSSKVTSMTAPGEVQIISLPDGSSLHLYGSSSVEFCDSWDSERDVQLNGDGFFEVKKGSQFTVHCKQGDVAVLGTSFSVSSREQRFNVQCLTGKVKVTSGINSEIIQPGEGVCLKNGRLNRSAISANKADLVTGVLIFEEEPLNLVFDELERVFSIKIEHPDIVGRPFSGELTGLQPEQSLDLIASTMGLRIVKSSDGLFIVSNQ